MTKDALEQIFVPIKEREFVEVSFHEEQVGLESS